MLLLLIIVIVESLLIVLLVLKKRTKVYGTFLVTETETKKTLTMEWSKDPNTFKDNERIAFDVKDVTPVGSREEYLDYNETPT